METMDTTENENLKANWTRQFLESDGWSYILNSLLEKSVSAEASETFSE